MGMAGQASPGDAAEAGEIEGAEGVALFRAPPRARIRSRAERMCGASMGSPKAFRAR